MTAAPLLPDGEERPLPTRVLVVDDEPSILRTLRAFLESRGYAVRTAAGGVSAVELVQRRSFDLVLLDMMLPDQDGLETLKQIKALDDNPSVLIMTGFGSVKTAIEALKSGAEDFLQKPLSLETLGLIIEKVRERQRLREECRYLRSRVNAHAGECVLSSRNKRMQEVFELIKKVAPLQCNVLIQGESGTGKELIARAIHRESPRAAGRFIALNCGVIPVHLLESELFGYERGAFTGAGSRKIGYFEAAAGGTILLDEISEMSMELQVKLLRVIQERSFQRLGGTEDIATDVRIIASTNRDLERELAQERFRLDLYYRINVVRIVVPPLRDRPEDIPLLSYCFLEKYAREFRKDVRHIEPAVMDVLQRHHWNGNVRELENVIERAVAMADGTQITQKELSRELTRFSLAPRTDEVLTTFRLAKLDFERGYLQRLLEKSSGNIALASRLADLPRQNLYEKLQKHSIDHGGYRGGAEPSPLAALASGA
jgi:two-component system, NtrC family, response regulator AtoC